MMFKTERRECMQQVEKSLCAATFVCFSQSVDVCECVSGCVTHS